MWTHWTSSPASKHRDHNLSVYSTLNWVHCVSLQRGRPLNIWSVGKPRGAERVMWCVNHDFSISLWFSSGRLSSKDEDNWTELTSGWSQSPDQWCHRVHCLTHTHHSQKYLFTNNRKEKRNLNNVHHFFLSGNSSRHVMMMMRRKESHWTQQNHKHTVAVAIQFSVSTIKRPLKLLLSNVNLMPYFVTIRNFRKSLEIYPHISYVSMTFEPLF